MSATGTIPEFEFKQFDLSDPLEQTIPLNVATNLVGASVQFLFRLPDAETNTVLEAVIVSASPSLAAATSVTVRNVWTNAAVAEPGVYAFEWKFVLADERVMPRSLSGATDDYPDRANQAFEIIAALSSGDSEEGDDIPMAHRPLVVADLAELAALPWSENYNVISVRSDLNGNMGWFEWDATINTADAEVNVIVPITSTPAHSPTGGFRRKTVQ